MSMTISIIIPLYNCRRFIHKCIKSCLNQGFSPSEFEVIVVNDCSTDGCENVVRKLAMRHTQIRLINHSENKGIDFARMTGFRASSGKYVAFIDNDDWYHKGILSKMVRLAEKKGYDIVDCFSRKVKTFCGVPFAWKRINDKVRGEICQPRLFDDYFISFFGKSLLSICVWPKIYRREIIEKSDYSPIGTYGEDLWFNLCVFPNIKKMFILDEIGHNYRFGGVSSRFRKRTYDDFKKLFFLRWPLLDKYHYEKARYFLCGELKNEFYSYICSWIKSKTDDEMTIKEYIRKEIAEPYWQEVLRPEHIDLFTKKEFCEAIIHRNEKMTFYLCKQKNV